MASTRMLNPFCDCFQRSNLRGVRSAEIKLTQRLEAIKPLGVAVQNSVLVVVGKMLVFNDLRNFTFAVIVIHFVGKIAGEHEGLVSDRFD